MVLGLTSSKILNLPPELLLLILGDLDGADLCTLGCTCKDLNFFVFPYFFDKYGAGRALKGTISFFWRAPTHLLRAVRCSLSTKNIDNICYHFDTGLETLAEEVEDMHAIVTKAKEIKDFEVYLEEPSCWELGFPPTASSSLLSNELARLYAELLTISLTKGCKKVVLGGRARFVNTRREQEQTTASGPSTLDSQSSDERDVDITSYFDGTFNRKSSFAAHPRRSRRISRLPSVPRKLEAPIPKIESVVLQCDMLFSDATFFDWTIQFLSWCAPTLTRLELQSPSTSREAWHQFFSNLNLPSLNQFKFAHATIHPSDILQFLSRHPNIQNLSLHHGIQLPILSRPRLPRPILPRLETVISDPNRLRWLVRDKKQCPELKEVTLLTKDWLHLRPFAYDVLDKALKDLLPWSSQLDIIGFHFQRDEEDLNLWLQSHVAGASGSTSAKSSILSKFVGMKRLQISSGYTVDIVDSPTRLELVAKFAGLFPNLYYLELQEQPGVAQKDDLSPVFDAVREHCPQVKRLKINHMFEKYVHPFDDDEEEKEEEEVREEVSRLIG